MSKGKYKPRPDIVVRCGDVGAGNFITDPLVVVEVLSPSTMDDAKDEMKDRGRKLEFYRTLQTLQHIVLVYQDAMRVEHYDRTESGWELDTLSTPDAVLDLTCIAFEISLKEIYADAL